MSYFFIRYDDENARESYMLMTRDAFSTLSMDHNLIPPFSMREAGINVRTAPKLQVEDTSIDNRSAHFPEENLKTPLKLHSFFAYFPLTKK